jgi:GNAT superfamily N-acetyltransferase
MIYYGVEELTQELIDEITPTLDVHRQELQSYKDMRLNPDWDSYKKIHELDKSRWIIARDEKDEIIGYALFIIMPNPHYKDFMYATEDVFYVVKGKRGLQIGAHLIRLSEEILKSMGVDVIVHHAKFTNEFAPFLERLGYKKTETMLAKRLTDEKQF